ncbi:MAG: hypothetical protein EXX96DRAFT_643915 [Benjaminiella poitrasii]|nr:MAG: hypothetical protein EXX96DRAFT_643915 [Benjaminiella poitrasii]
MYLKRKRKRRVDRLIFILIKNVEQDYINNIARAMSNVGRMGPEERRRRRELVVEEVNEELLPDMAEEVSSETLNNTYCVKDTNTTEHGTAVLPEDGNPNRDASILFKNFHNFLGKIKERQDNPT